MWKSLASLEFSNIAIIYFQFHIAFTKQNLLSPENDSFYFVT